MLTEEENEGFVSMDAYQILKEEYEKLQDQLEEEQNAHTDLKKQFSKIDEDIKLSEERMKAALEEREKIDRTQNELMHEFETLTDEFLEKQMQYDKQNAELKLKDD